MIKLLLFVLLLGKSTKIKIGVNFPLTGPVAAYGKHCLEGIELGAINHPEIELIIKDNEGMAENAIVILRKLAEEGAVGVIGPLISSNAIIAGLEASELGIPLILPGATNTAITKVSRFLFRVCYTDEQQGKALANFSYSSLGKREVNVIADTTNIYSGSLALYFKREFENLGGTVQFIEWDGTTDLSETMQKLMNSTVFLPLYYENVVPIIKNAQTQNLNITFLGADGWDAPELFKALEEDTGKLYFSTHYCKTEEGIQKFAGLYKEKYGEDPNAFAALGFDAINLLLLAIREAEGMRPGDIQNSLSNITAFDGVTGFFKYDHKRDPLKDIFILQLHKGDLLLIDKL